MDAPPRDLPGPGTAAGPVTAVIGDREQLLDIVDAMVNARRVVERVPWWDRNRNRKFRTHATVLPPLLTALADAACPGGPTSDEQDSVRHPPTSRPPIVLDAVDRLLAIQSGTTRWLNRCDLPGRARLVDDLRQLAAHSARMHSTDLALLVIDARSWRVWAEVAVHERGSSWTPDAPCPCCEKRNVLRVRPDAERAYCSRCEAVWDGDTITILARHVDIWSRQRHA